MNYISRFLTNFEKKEYIRKNYSLNNIKYFLSRLGNPQDKLNNIIHITGTNGKGSVANYISKILENFGYKVGLYTSPHIFKVNERICINHQPISDNDLNRYLRYIYEVGLSLRYINKLTYFEILTCVMFLYFAEQKNDFNVLEVGLGGKLDATNVISKSLVSVITRVGLDHTEVLGDTIEKIILDKSEIIRPNSYCVLSKNCAEVKNIVKKVCEKRDVKLKLYGRDFRIKNVELNIKGKFISFDYYGDNKIKELKSKVSYLYQPENIATAISVIEVLKYLGKISKFDIERIRSATKMVFYSRFEFVSKKNIQNLGLKIKNLIFDGSHNPLAIENFVKTVKMYNFKNIILCFSIMKEKDYKSCIKILSQLEDRLEKVLIYKLPLERNQDVDLIFNEFKKYLSNKKIERFCDLSSMLKFIQKFAKNHNNIIFTGTFYAEKIVFSKMEKL